MPLKQFTGNPRLEELNIGHNNLEKLVAYQFPPLLSLKRLLLGGNSLSQIDPKAFLNLGTSLEELDLKENRLTTINEEAVRSLYGLQVKRRSFVRDLLCSK